MNSNNPSTTPENAAGTPDVAKKPNYVYITCPDITGLNPDSGYFSISPGQPNDAPTGTCTDGQCEIYINAGRHKTTQVATTYDGWCGGATNEFCAYYYSTPEPGSLNFAFGFNFTFNINNNSYNALLFLGQGSIAAKDEDWWIGSPNITNDIETNTVVLAVTDLENNIVATYQIVSEGNNSFVLNKNS